MKASRYMTLGLLSIISTGAALAADVYPKVYDATFDTKTAQGTMQVHQVSDGKGKMRNETTVPGGQKMVTIIDMPNHACYTIMAAPQKMIIKGTFKSEMKPIDKDAAKELNATDLGQKMVNNHMCQGWSYKSGKSSTETWVDKDAGVTVKSVTSSAGQTTETNLKTLSTNAPPPSSFQVPTSGYKVMATQ